VSLRIFARGRFWLGALLLLFLLAALVFCWGWWRWEQLSHPGPESSRAWQIAPADTAFFYLVPNVPKFYQRFFRYHSETLSSPTLAAARKERDQNPLLAPPPNLPVPPDLLELMKHSGKVALFDYFTALLPPAENQKQFRFLIGGKCLSASLSEASFVRSTRKNAGYVWKEETREGLRCRTVELPHQTLWLLTSGDWLLISNDWAALSNAANSAGETLDAEPVFQRARDYALREALVWIYANPRAVATAAGRMENLPLQEALEAMAPGLLAASWGWHSLGPRSVAYDLISFTLSDAALQTGQEALLPLDPEVFLESAPDTLWTMAGSTDLAKLTSLPILTASRVEALAPLARKQRPDRFYYQISRDPESGKRHFAWKPPFDSKPPDWIEPTGTLTGAEQPFFEARIDYRGIVKATLEEVKADWPAWRKALQDQGWPAPDTAPDLDVDRYFSKIRVTAGFEEGHLALFNALQLRDSGSTLLTSLVTLTAQFAPDAMASRMEKARTPFADLASSNSAQWANALDISLLSGLFLSPIFMHDHGGNMPVDLLMLQVLASGIEPPAEE